MATKINIRIDNREWNLELPGKATNEQVQAAIRDITSAYPIYRQKLISIERTGWVHERLAPIADGWLSVNPAWRYGLYWVSGAMIGVAVLLYRMS